MADDNDIVLKIGADTEQIKKDLAALSGKIKSDPPGKDAGDAFGDSFKFNIIAINQGIELLKKSFHALNTVVDFAKKGEEIAAIGTRFAALAEQAGLAPEKMADGIEKAVGGTVDMEDAMKSATSAMIALGSNSERIPQVFDLAKKASMQFGGEVTDRFEQISSAIASGSTKMLRNIGLTINADEAYQSYANHVGVLKENLSEAQRQQAIMNAVLESGDQKFKNINASITPISENMKKAFVAFKELGDTAAIALNKAFGPTIISGLKGITEFLEVLNIKMGVTFNNTVPSATENIKLLQQHLATLKEQMNFADGADQTASMQQQIDSVNQQILAEQSLVFQKQTTAAVNQSLFDAESDRRKMAEEEAKMLHENELYRLREGETEYETHVKKMKEQSEALGQAIKNAFVNMISNSIQHMVKNLMAGKNAFTGFVALIAGMIGELAIQVGMMMMTTGIGMLALGQMNPFTAILAGAGLIAVGTVLKVLSGGQGSDTTGGGAGSTSSITQGTDANSFTKEEDRVTPQTGVQVVVQGNVFDSKETGLQIAQILNDSFDLSGTLVRANA